MYVPGKHCVHETYEPAVAVPFGHGWHCDCPYRPCVSDPAGQLGQPLHAPAEQYPFWGQARQPVPQNSPPLPGLNFPGGHAAQDPSPGSQSPPVHTVAADRAARHAKTAVATLRAGPPPGRIPGG